MVDVVISPFDLASRDIDFIEDVFKRGYDINNEKTGNGYTFLDCALLYFENDTVHQNIGKIELAIKYGANVNQQTRYDNTPLHWAAQRCQFEIVMLLIKNGADIDIKGHKGRNVIDYLYNWIYGKYYIGCRCEYYNVYECHVCKSKRMLLFMQNYDVMRKSLFQMMLPILNKRQRFQ